jgi:DMSO/TMAO reductase YedYZ molybdopterin-dependent catalytic subunit
MRPHPRPLTRRRLLHHGAIAGLAAYNLLSALPAFAAPTVNLPLPGGPDERDITTAFPQKGALILQRTRPPLLETPFEVFDQDVFTPNDQFYVRWHWAVIPTSVDVDKFRLNVHGSVNRPLSINAPEIRVDFSSRVSPAANGPTARWVMRGGPGCV